MPSTSSLTASEKALVKRAVPERILAVALARIYYAYPNPSKWSFSGLQGALVFAWAASGGVLRCVDLLGTRGVLWSYQLGHGDGWDYFQDRKLFHTFPGDVSLSASLTPAHSSGLHDRLLLLQRVRGL